MRKDKLKFEEIRSIVDYYNQGLSIKNISDVTKRSQDTINKYLYLNGIFTERGESICLKKEPKRKTNKILLSSQMKEDMVTLYKVYGNYNKVAKELNLSKSFVLRFLKKNGYVKENFVGYRYKSSLWRKYSLDESYFDIIDSQDKSYILGFLYADGYNNTKHGVLQVALHTKDIEVLNYIKEKMRFNGGIESNFRGKYSRLSITSKKTSLSLEKWGCMQAKTFYLKFPTFLDAELMRHFIRGYLDGDGSIQTSKNCKTTTVSFIGNVDFLTDLNRYLSEVLNVELRHIRKYAKCNNSIGELRYSKKKTVRAIKHLLYDNAEFFLKRKYEKINYYNGDF